MNKINLQARTLDGNWVSLGLFRNLPEITRFITERIKGKSSVRSTYRFITPNSNTWVVMEGV